VENLKSDEKAAIVKEVEQETKTAIMTISGRLLDYYSREIDDFYKAEFSKLVPFKASLTEDYLKKIRAIFEKSAQKRGPILTRLWLMTEGPPPIEPIPLEGKDISKAEATRRIKIRTLQDEIKQLDSDYDLAVRDLESKNLGEIDSEFEKHQKNYDDKKKEIDERAKNEAMKLVKNFTSSLSQRIFSRYSFHLKEIPAKTVNFPKMSAQPEVPRVTFERNQVSRNEQVELAKELDTFLILKHYQRANSAVGARNVTKEFIEWRTNLKSGHWESWQKSSAQK
jgi:hypothetical protein